MTQENRSVRAGVSARVLALGLAAFFMAWGGGCALKVKDVKAPSFEQAVEANKGRGDIRGPEGHGKLLVGVCFSGGGSRAAYLAQQVMRRLHETRIDVKGERVRLIDEIDYISAVSGGSLAAAYHALYWPTGRRNPKKYFKQFGKAMGRNIQDAVILRMFSPSWVTKLTFSDIQRTDLLARYFNRKFFGGAKWSLLKKYSKAGLSPTLLLNSVIYQSERFGFGRKFVFTSLGSDDFYVPKKSKGTVKEEGVKTLGSREDSRGSETIVGEALQVLTLDDLGLEHGNYPVARSVTASAAFPILIRPLRILDRRARLKKAVLLGDGGIYDNLGTEAMTQRLVKVLKNSSYRGALLIVVNAEAPYQFGEGFRMVSVIHKLAETRARVLSRVLMDRLAAALPKQKKIHVVEIPLKKGGSSLKESKTIWKIPTAFKISKDHRKLVGKAVKRLMKARRPRIRSIAKELLRSESARQGAPKTSVSPEAREGSGGGGKAPPSVRPSPTPKVPAAGTFHGDPGDPASPRAPASPGAPDPNTSSGTRPRTPAPR